jgi:hypothetical protein
MKEKKNGRKSRKNKKKLQTSGKGEQFSFINELFLFCTDEKKNGKWNPKKEKKE